MAETDRNQDRLRAIRDVPATPRGLRVVMQHQEWLWRKAGLVLAAMIAIAVGTLTLTPVPSASLMMGGIDKVYHALAFAALIFPLIVTDSRRWFWAVPLVIAYGGAIELIQPTVGRSAEWLDFGADITGVLAGAALAELFHDRIHAGVFADRPQIEQVDPAADDDARMDEMRAELMAELRVLLREELATARDPRAAGDRVHTPVAEGASPPPRPGGDLRH